MKVKNKPYHNVPWQINDNNINDEKKNPDDNFSKQLCYCPM